MALLPTGFKERLEQMELCRNQRLSLLQAEKEVQFTKSQVLASKISAIKLADHRCLNLQQQIASKHFVISSLKSRIDCLDSQYVDVSQQFRALKSEVQELEELEREKDKYFVSETKEMEGFKVELEKFAVESRKQVQELKNQVEQDDYCNGRSRGDDSKMYVVYGHLVIISGFQDFKVDVENICTPLAELEVL
ncbi:uncharacterized protein LOC108193304 isoform X2 [Daucus carota subsp. sativus]|uniref:Uncharacterized protein n=1 Tax=Daucus carota subsp. sativus TaxID=79200 RepID=A0A166ILE1_DAUCS|nr:PREDICTED: uncharacterized protein LOC108193304 isoform X3 [Daucus carota subsp. sativus]